MHALIVLSFIALQAPAPAAATAEARPAVEPVVAESVSGATAVQAAETVVVGVSDDVFEDGVRAFEAGDEVTAANKMWHYLKGSPQTADHYEWAELYLARALLREGFTHGGLEYLYNVARERKRPELLPVALSIIEQVREVHPYDEELIDRDLLAGTDFGALPPANKSFVEFQQGRIDLIEGEADEA